MATVSVKGLTIDRRATSPKADHLRCTDHTDTGAPNKSLSTSNTAFDLLDNYCAVRSHNVCRRRVSGRECTDRYYQC